MSGEHKQAGGHHFRVSLVHSGAGRLPAQRATLKGLGLGRMRQAVRLRDTPAIRGMICRVSHLVAVERCPGTLPPSARMAARQASRS